MRLPPLEVIQSWPKANYANPEGRGPANIILNLILIPLVGLIPVLRFYTRLRLTKSFGLDDWLIAAALLPTTAFAVISLVIELRYGWNRHVWDMPFDQITLGLKYVLTMEVLFTLSATLTKLSMLALTFRIMGNSGRLGGLIKATFVLILCECITFTCAMLFQCRPPSDYWNLTFEEQPKCVSEQKVLLVGGIMNTAADLLVVVIPIPRVLALQLPRRKTLSLALLFGVGFLINLVGAARVYFTWKIMTTYDRTWALFPVWITSSVELYIGVICACVPALKRFFMHYLPVFLRSSTSHKTDSDPNIYYSPTGNVSRSGTDTDVELLHNPPHYADFERQDKCDLSVTTIFDKFSPRNRSQGVNAEIEDAISHGTDANSVSESQAVNNKNDSD